MRLGVVDLKKIRSLNGPRMEDDMSENANAIVRVLTQAARDFWDRNALGIQRKLGFTPSEGWQRLKARFQKLGGVTPLDVNSISEFLSVDETAPKPEEGTPNVCVYPSCGKRVAVTVFTPINDDGSLKTYVKDGGTHPVRIGVFIAKRQADGFLKVEGPFCYFHAQKARKDVVRGEEVNLPLQTYKDASDRCEFVNDLIKKARDRRSERQVVEEAADAQYLADHGVTRNSEKPLSSPVTKGWPVGKPRTRRGRRSDNKDNYDKD